MGDFLNTDGFFSFVQYITLGKEQGKRSEQVKQTESKSSVSKYLSVVSLSDKTRPYSRLSLRGFSGWGFF